MKSKPFHRLKRPNHCFIALGVIDGDCDGDGELDLDGDGDACGDGDCFIYKLVQSHEQE